MQSTCGTTGRREQLLFPIPGRTFKTERIYMERRQTVIPLGSTTPRTRNQRAQNKPQDAKKGKRRTVGGTKAKTKTWMEIDLQRKKPGRAKQIFNKQNLSQKKRKSPK
jgi:hypothetical protein